MAGAPATAHQLGILHRDVKPANILLIDHGEPALSDFGIAHIAGGFTTATGTFTGSPAFTAREILSGDPPSRTSDAYALGSTLFAAVTGHGAFERPSREQLVHNSCGSRGRGALQRDWAPNSAMTPSPVNLSTVPEKRATRTGRLRSPVMVRIGAYLSGELATPQYVVGSTPAACTALLPSYTRG
jgi:non-specific serine/threonine protein kinase